MAFWGIEVEPGKPFIHRFKKSQGRLRISHATLGLGFSPERSVLQCKLGDKPPIFLCSLRPPKNESCQLDIEFEEEEDVVFEVIGVQNVHLTGFYLGSARSEDVGIGKKMIEDGGDYVIALQRKTDTITQDAQAENEINKRKQKNKTQKTEEKKVLIVETKDQKTEVNPCQIRTLDNGLVIEELEMGQPNGQLATLNSKVSVHYIVKLPSSGLVIEANVGTTPMEFKPGDGRVIEGVEMGVNGMRLGGKRKLTVPPSVGYQYKKSGVPADSWLEIEVHLVNICHP